LHFLAHRENVLRNRLKEYSQIQTVGKLSADLVRILHRITIPIFSNVYLKDGTNLSKFVKLNTKAINKTYYELA